MKKRIIALLLMLALVFSCLPVIGGAEELPATEISQRAYARADAIFEEIDRLESVRATRNTDQSRITDAVAALVMETDTYVEGSLRRNGDAFSWMTTDGIRCGYSPRMREIEENMTPPVDPVESGIYNEPVAVRGGSPTGKQVYLVGPYYGFDSNFTNQYKNEATRIAAAIGDTDGYTLYSGKSATVDKVAEAVSKGAVVIFDSHGSTDYESGNDCVSGATSSYLCLTSTSGLTDADYADGAVYHSSGIFINGATIANHMKSNSPGGILWMAICLGMATNTICNPLREKGVEVVYGYSQSVTFTGDYLFEEAFWDQMCEGKTVAEAASYMKTTWGNWDMSTQIAKHYGYSGYSTISSARANYTAFPVVVSDEDSHPGQRNKNLFYGADSLQTVKSTYGLFNRCSITAVSSDTAMGTVSVSDSTIFAAPEVGYEVQGYTILSGAPTVTQVGETFHVETESDCTIQINFVPLQKVTVTFKGRNTTQVIGYAGDSMELPTPEAPDGYTFCGWTQSAMGEASTTKPAVLTDYFTPTESTILYPVYSYAEETTGDYVRITQTPESWEGEYLIVYEATSDSYMLDGSLTSYDTTGNYCVWPSYLRTIPAAEGDAYSFTIKAYDTGYSIQGTSGMYIGNPDKVNGLTSDSSPMVNKISMADVHGRVNIVGSGGAYLRYNYNSRPGRFRYYTSSGYAGSIYLYKKEEGTVEAVWYTTLQNQCTHTVVENGNCTDCGASIAAKTAGGYWQTMQEAVNSETGLVQLLTNVKEPVTADTLQVDLNGYTMKDLTVKTALLGCDSSATATQEGTGSILALQGPVAPEYTVDGVRYIALSANGGYTFHVLELSMETLSLRTDVAGLYYRGALACDSTLRRIIDRHGVALSTVDMPGADYNEAHNLFTEKTGAPEGEFASVMVSGIFKADAADNEQRGKMAVYANAYLVLEDGSVLLSDNTNTDSRKNVGFDGVAYSLYDMMTAVDLVAPTLPAAQQTALKSFCNTWNAPMADWQLKNLIG